MGDKSWRTVRSHIKQWEPFRSLSLASAYGIADLRACSRLAVKLSLASSASIFARIASTSSHTKRRLNRSPQNVTSIVSGSKHRQSSMSLNPPSIALDPSVKSATLWFGDSLHHVSIRSSKCSKLFLIANGLTGELSAMAKLSRIGLRSDSSFLCGCPHRILEIFPPAVSMVSIDAHMRVDSSARKARFARKAGSTLIVDRLVVSSSDDVLKNLHCRRSCI